MCTNIETKLTQKSHSQYYELGTEMRFTIGISVAIYGIYFLTNQWVN